MGISIEGTFDRPNVKYAAMTAVFGYRMEKESVSSRKVNNPREKEEKYESWANKRIWGGFHPSNGCKSA